MPRKNNGVPLSIDLDEDGKVQKQDDDAENEDLMDDGILKGEPKQVSPNDEMETMSKMQDKIGVDDEDEDSESKSTFTGNEKGEMVKRAKVDKMLDLSISTKPENSYEVYLRVEAFQGGFVGGFFQNPRSHQEPFLPLFRPIFQQGMKERLKIDFMAKRCDAQKKMIPSRNIPIRAGTKVYGWNIYMSESVHDEVNFGVNLCNHLNKSEEYRSQFDATKTSGKYPFFFVLDSMTASPKRYLDEAIMDEDVANYVVFKYSLSNLQARRQLQHDENWIKILQPYFKNPLRGKEVVEEFVKEHLAKKYKESNENM